jgi:hypothetical protein
MAETIDVIGGLIDWLREHETGLVFERTNTKFTSVTWPNSWFFIYGSNTVLLGQVTLVWPGSVPPGLQYDFRTSDKYGFLYCRKEWQSIYAATIFDDVLETARSLEDGKPVAWHKFFRYTASNKGRTETIHRVRDTSWPPKFM